MSFKAFRILLSATTLLGTLSILSSGPAQASYTNCDNPPLQRFGSVVGKSSNFTIEGASAQMIYRLGNICTTDQNPGTNFSTAWTMVSSYGADAYAQSGLMYQYGWGCWLHFAEQLRAPGAGSNRVILPSPCVSNGESHRTWQQVVNVISPSCCDWRMRSNIDSTILMQSTWSPFSNWVLPYNAEFAGETTHNNSDIPGYKVTGLPPPVNFSGLQVQSWHDDNWYSTCGRTNFTKVQHPRYSSSVLSCNSTESWTSG